LQVEIETKACQEAEVILNCGQDKALLRLFREETTLLVLMVHVKNQARQDDWRAEHSAEFATDDLVFKSSLVDSDSDSEKKRGDDENVDF
jgi:hypothetical protein